MMIQIANALSEDEKTEINNGISEIKSWLNGGNRTTEEYEEKLSELQQRLEPLVSRLFPSAKPSVQVILVMELHQLSMKLTSLLK